MKTVRAKIPKGFATSLQILFYADILILTGALWVGGRGLILERWYALLAGVIALAFIGHWIRLYAGRRDFYVVDERGILDRGFLGAGVWTEWGEVAGTKPYNWLGFRGIKVRLKDTGAFLRRRNARDWLTSLMNLVCYGSPIVLWQAWSDVPVDEMEAAIQERLAEPTPAPVAVPVVAADPVPTVVTAPVATEAAAAPLVARRR